MPDREHTEPSVTGTDEYQIGNMFYLMQVIRVCQHYPFRFSGCSGGVNERHYIIGFTLIDFSVNNRFVGVLAALQNRLIAVNFELTRVRITRFVLGVTYNGF